MRSLATFPQTPCLIGTRWGAYVDQKGDSEIGSTTGGAMATSEEADPAPSVEVSEGADIPTKERRACG